jgi:N-acetylglucosamine malate deacetylase 1
LSCIEIQKNCKKKFMQHYDVLAIGAHPDDIEAGIGGILIDLVKRNTRCAVAILTQGELGTGGTTEIRAEEVKDGAGLLGADVAAFFDWGDTKLEDHYDKRLALAKIIRQTRPRLILTPYPHVGHGRNQSHPDHVAAGILTVNAANLASLKKVELSLDPHLMPKILHYFLAPGVQPSCIVDITSHFDQWMAAVSAHRSQFLNPEKSRDYIEFITAMARSYGLQAHCKYGQALFSPEPLLIKNLMSLID